MNKSTLSPLCRFTGSAGQSFACFLTPGMNIRLIGEANDYVGKVCWTTYILSICSMWI